MFELASSLGIGIAKNYPFLDGNRRTSFLLMYVFFATNAFTIETSENEVVKVMLGVAEGTLKEPELAIWLKKNSNSI